MKLALILACLMVVVAAGGKQPVEAGADPQVAHAFWRGEVATFRKGFKPAYMMNVTAYTNRIRN